MVEIFLKTVFLFQSIQFTRLYMDFSLRILSEKEFINKDMYVYILKLYSQQHILFSQQGIPHMQIKELPKFTY